MIIFSNKISWIKWSLMILGGFRFSWQGAIMGFFLGYCIEEILKGNFDVSPKNVFKKRDEVKFTQHQIRLMILTASVMKADGFISSPKIKFVKKYFFRQFGSVYGVAMMKNLQHFADTDYDLTGVAKDMQFASNATARLSIFQFLYQITIQGKVCLPIEKELLKKIGITLGISYQDFENIINGKQQQKKQSVGSFFKEAITSHSAYQLLKVSPAATDKEVKKAYRKLVLVYHPDKTSLDEKIATQKFNEITEAFEKIKKSRGMK